MDLSSRDLSSWAGVPGPQRTTLEGRYARLEPLDPSRHGQDLLASAQAPAAEDRFRYLFEEPPATAAEFAPWLEQVAASADPLFFAVVDRETGRGSVKNLGQPACPSRTDQPV